MNRNGIYVKINNATLYVGIISIFIKYQYVNVIWFFILVSFIYLYSHVYKCLHMYTILRLPGDHMYLAAKKSVSNLTTYSSPTGGEHIKSNDYLVRQKVFFHSLSQISNNLLYLYNDSHFLMSFRIFLYLFRLYIKHCSPL